MKQGTAKPKGKVPPNYLTKEEFAVKLQVSGPTIDNWSRMGRLRPIKIGRRVYFDSNLDTISRIAIK